MIKKIRTKNIDGRVEMISSKSLFHRYLIMASRLANASIKFKGLSNDVKTTIDALIAMGSKIQVKEDELTISGFEKISENHINFGESGSSLRFLLPYAFIEEGTYEFTGEKRLPDRPIADLIDELKNKKVTFTSDKLPFKASGKIEGAFFKLNSNVSSQYISGLMMAGSFISDKVEIKLKSEIKSLSYVKMTASVMKDFGFDTQIQNNKIIVQKMEEKQEIKTIKIEGDWSNALVPMALAILKGQVIIKGLNEDSYQGDSNLVRILENAGADINWVNSNLVVKESKLNCFDLDLEDNIDAFLVLSILALSCKGKSILRNIERLRLKESDRIAAALDLHKKIGAKSYVKDDKFIVVPDEVKSFEIDSYDDHRLVMAALVASALADIEVTIKNFEAIDKSYTGFAKDMEDIGVSIGEIDEI